MKKILRNLRRLLKIIRKFGKIAGYKINTKAFSLVFYILSMKIRN